MRPAVPPLAGGFTRGDNSAAVGGHAGVSAGGTSVQSAIWIPGSGVTPATVRYANATGSNFGSDDAPGSDGFGSPGVIPEPSTVALWGAALGFFGWRACRRAQRMN